MATKPPLRALTTIDPLALASFQASIRKRYSNDRILSELRACAERLGVGLRECYVVGDAVWDLLAARRADMLSIGLLSGGYGEDELTKAGAYRVYRDAAELNDSLDELGVLP